MPDATPPQAAAPSPPANTADGAGAPTRPARRRDRPRRISQTRRLFLGAINAQIAGTRVLAILVFVVLLAGGFVWLLGTTGSPLIGVSFLALAAMLAVTIYWFLQVMGMFQGKR